MRRLVAAARCTRPRAAVQHQQLLVSPHAPPAPVAAPTPAACGVRWCSTTPTPEETPAGEAKKEPEKWPIDTPMHGVQMRQWMDATDFDLNGFFVGVIQAYAAVAYVNLNETGKDRWASLPVDAKAASVLESHKTKTDEFNGSELAKRIAHPEDMLYRLSIKDLTLKADGEQYATVRLWVDTHPEALFGDDMEVAQKLFFKGEKDEEATKSLSVRFLELLYSAYFENERVPPSLRNRVIETWEGVRKIWRDGEDPVNVVLVSRFFKWFIQKQPKPRRLKEWVFRRDASGNWNLAELGVLCSRDG